jgi:hypothetical protein
MAQTTPTKEKESTEPCQICGGILESQSPLPWCTSCNNKGWYIDPAGGVHTPSPDDEHYDPAAMYE